MENLIFYSNFCSMRDKSDLKKLQHKAKISAIALEVFCDDGVSPRRR